MPKAHPSPLSLLIFKPRLDIQSPRWLKFPRSIHSLVVSPILEKELRILQACLIIWTEKLYPSASRVMVNMGPFWEFHISFLEDDHVCFFTCTPTFSCVQSGNRTWCGVNAHNLCGLQSLFTGNLERSVQQHAFLFLYISNFRPLDKYLANAMDSCWNAASGILGQGERALPFFKGPYNQGNSFLEEPCHCALDMLDGMPEGNGFSLAQLEMWPCNLCCGW